MSSITDTVLSIISGFGGTADIHDVINHISMADVRIVDIEDAMTELTESDRLAKDEVGYYQLMD